jgi:tetratricopeptide (TPR) repeat protein
MKPLFVYFFKKTNIAAFGARKKNPQIKDCEAMAKEFKMRALTTILREFVCVRIEMDKADSTILKKYRVRKAPTAVLVDLKGKTVWSCAGKFTWKKVEKILLKHLKRADSMVKKLAKGKEGDPMADRARTRAAEIDRRVQYAKGESYFLRAQWSKAKDIFRKVAAGDDKDFYVKRAAIMLEEIEAAGLYFAAVADIKRKRYQAAKVKLDKILNDLKKARSFATFAREKLASIKSKLKKK